MGLFDGLKSFNEDVRDATDSVVDNDALSVQDTVRGGLEATTGAGDGAGESDGDETQFAVDSAEFFQGVDSAIAAPGQAFGEATEGTALDTGATGTTVKGTGAAGEGVYDILVKDSAAIAYGTATGADLRQTEDPEHATDDYAPGALETVDLAAVTATGGVGGAVTKGGTKVATKIPKALGGLTDALRGGSKVTDEAVEVSRSASSAADDTVETIVDTGEDFVPAGDGPVGSLKLPDHLANTTSKGSISASKVYKSIPHRKKAAGVVGLGVVGEATGANDFLAGGLPGGYTVDHQYQQGPGGKRIKETDNDGNVLGYWVSVGTDGGTHRILTPSYSLSGGVSTSSVEFPTDRTPTFTGPGAADSAYTEWARQQTDPSAQGDPSAGEQRDTEPAQGAWGEASVVRKLNHGWYLAEQKHKQKERSRFFVVGQTSDGSRLYLGPSGGVSQSPHPFSTAEKANKAYQTWRQSGSGGTAPDPKADRPKPSDIVRDVRSSLSGGVLDSLSTRPLYAGAALGLGALLLYVLYTVVM